MDNPGDFRLLEDDLVAAIRQRIGEPTSKSYPQAYVTVANQDAIRHWAYGIGDYNPLYLDEDYAAAGPHGGIVAPPSMAFVFSRGVTGGVTGMAGIHGLIVETKLTLYRQIRPGDQLSGNSVIADVREKAGAFSKRQIELVTEGVMRDAKGEVVAKIHNFQRRMERGGGRKSSKYDNYVRPVYSEEQLQRLWEFSAAEKPRGALARPFASVAVGDEIDAILRGPLTTSDIIVFLQGWGGQYVRAHGDWVRWARRHLAGTIRNPLNIPYPAEAVHWDDSIAQQTGVPAAYDYAVQRFGWMSTALTNWMGDAGMLRSLAVQFRRHVFVGEAIWIRGRVTATTRNDGLISIALEAKTDAGELVATGEGEVLLPLSAAAQ